MAPDPNSPIRHFWADSPFMKSESAWGCANAWSATELYEVEEGISPQILRKQAKGNFWQIEIDNFLRKTDKFCANRPCTAPGGVVCRGTAGGLFRHLL